MREKNFNLSGPLKIVLSLLGAWILTLVVLYVFPHLLPVLTGVARLLSLPVGVVLLLIAVVALIRDKEKVSALLSIVLIATTAWLSLTRSLEWGAWLHFQLFRGRYEARVAEINSLHSRAEKEKLCGEDCYPLDDSERVAFHYVHGFLNWHDLVYDPTGEIMERDFEKKQKRFGWYFISAEPLSGNWYLAHFGD